MNNYDSKVLILAHTPEPEKICAAAARISTTFGSATEIYDGTKEDDAKQLVPKVLKLGHLSLIEHVNFTISFENVSVFVEQFMIEFRLASFTIKSRRYVDFSKMGYHVPQLRFVQDITENEKQAVEKLYSEHIKELFAEYSYLVEQGIPKEDARFILPYSYKSNFYCTVNARELLHIIYAAVYGRGSKFSEIKNIGESLLKQAKQICPSIFADIEMLEAGREDKEERLRALLGEFSTSSDVGKEISELVSYTNNPEKVVAIAAVINHRLCSTEKAAELMEANPDLWEKVLQIAIEDKRKRELEQISFTFRINKISLAGLTHLVRHRMQSVNVPSFTEFGISADYIIPQTIASEPELLARYQALWEKHYALVHKFEAGVVPEDLVYLYLSGNVLDVVTTMNARELFHFLRLRTCHRAQWEIRNIAIDILKKLRKAVPRIFTKAGPACYTSGSCPEGKLTCGKMPEARKFFERL